MATITPSVRIPRITETQLFIDGRWEPSSNGKTFPTVNPATEEVLAEIAEGTPEDVDRAVRAARRALEDGPWAKMDARDRGALLHKLADAIEREKEDLAVLETLDNGKRIGDSRSIDIPLTVEALRYYAGYADKIYGKTIPVRGPFFTYTRREPVGVAGQIIPWNFPMVNVAWKWAPALAAGCTVVMKPAEQTPLTALRLARIAKEAGIPDGVVNVVPGDGPNHGSGHRASSGRGQDRLHRIVRGRPDRDAGGGLHAEARDPGARRQEPEHRLRRQRPGDGHSPVAQRDLLESGAGLCGGEPVVRRGQGVRPGGREDRRAEQEVQNRRSARSRDGAGPPGRPHAIRHDHAVYPAWAGAGGRVCDRREAMGRARLLRRADALRRREGRDDDRQGRDLRPGPLCACGFPTWTR